MKLTIGELIDRLSIANIRLWHLQDVIASSQEDVVVARAAKDVEKVNAERTCLRNAVNDYFGNAVESEKTYG